jgi:hypothetical protein
MKYLLKNTKILVLAGTPKILVVASSTTATPTPTPTPTNTPTPTPTPANNSAFENALIYSMLDFNFIDPPSIDYNEPVYSE